MNLLNAANPVQIGHLSKASSPFLHLDGGRAEVDIKVLGSPKIEVVDVTGVVVPAHQIHLHSGYRYTIHRGQVVIVVLGVVAEAGLAELGSPAIRLPGDSLPERGSSKEMMDLATASA